MNSILPASQPVKDSSKKSNLQEVYHAIGEKGFEKHLDDTMKVLKKDTTDKSQETDILLMQLINLLNINILRADFKTKIDHKENFLEVDLPNSCFEMNSLTDELIECWQEILLEFSENGAVSQENAKMFYSAIKKAIPQMPNIDFEMLHDQITGILGQNKNDPMRDHHIHQNNLVQKYNSTTPELPIKDESGNAEMAKPQSHYSKHDHQDLSINVKEHSNKKVNAENVLSGTQVEHADDIVFRHRDTSFFTVQEQHFVAIEKTNPDITIHSTVSHQLSDIFEQLVDKVNLSIREGIKQVNIRLKPDYLGDVLIKVFTDKDKIKAEFFVNNTQVKTMLRVHVSDFQNKIREQGYNLSEVNVFEMSDGFEMSAFNQQAGGNNHNQDRKFAWVYKHESKAYDDFIDDYYSLWGDDSKVNYIA